MASDDATRDRVRALVRDVLSKAVTTEPERTSSAAPSVASSPSPSLPGNITRDESAKLVITEDDVRGLERGAVLRISESARLTPLAAHIVNDLGSEVARNSREHNDANVLTLGSKTITSDQMREIVRAWLGTEITEDRHRKRVAKIDAVERQYQR